MLEKVLINNGDNKEKQHIRIFILILIVLVKLLSLLLLLFRRSTAGRYLRQKVKVRRSCEQHKHKRGWHHFHEQQ